MGGPASEDDRRRHAGVTPRAPEGARPTYLIESVDSALRLLHMLVDAERIRVSEAAVRLGVAPSTAHRLLQMLQYHGFVAQDPRSHEYVPGPDLMRLGLAAINQLDVRTLAHPVMERLCSEVNETIALAVLQGTNVVYIDGFESTRALRIGARTGAVIPAHAIAMGKALLSALPAERFETLYADEALPVLTARTTTTRTALSRQLAEVRKRGYAQSSGESEEGVASIAAPVVTDRGELRAAVSIGAPALRLTPQRVKEFVPLLKRAVAEIGSRCR